MSVLAEAKRTLCRLAVHQYQAGEAANSLRAIRIILGVLVAEQSLSADNPPRLSADHAEALRYTHEAFSDLLRAAIKTGHGAAMAQARETLDALETAIGVGLAVVDRASATPVLSIAWQSALNERRLGLPVPDKTDFIVGGTCKEVQQMTEAAEVVALLHETAGGEAEALPGVGGHVLVTDDHHKPVALAEYDGENPDDDTDPPDSRGPGYLPAA